VAPIILECKFVLCKEPREGFPGSDIYCREHAQAAYAAAQRAKPNEQPILLWCPIHATISTPMQPYEANAAKLRHERAGCESKILTFKLDRVR